MLIAIPINNNELDSHFGHCKKFALITIDQKEKKIVSRKDVDVPAQPHQPGLLPAWLAQLNINLVIAGGMGQRAQDLLDKSGIKVLVGAPSESPEKLVNTYLDGSLTIGANCCDH